MTTAREALDAFAERKRLFWLDPPRGTCPGCGDEDVILHGAVLDHHTDGVCASCRAREAVRDRTYPCDDCGGDKAFRDPLGREDVMLCMECHAKSGYIPGERTRMRSLVTRESQPHPQGRREKCSAAGYGTTCGGQVKPRGSNGVLCDWHHDPKRRIAAKQI